MFHLIACVESLDLSRDFMAVLEIAEELAGVSHRDDTRPRWVAPEPMPPQPTCDLGAIIAPLETLGRLDGRNPNAVAVERYLAERHVLDAARADRWFALPPYAFEVLRDLFSPETLDASGLVRAGGWNWAEHVLCIPWRGPGGTVETLQRRRLGDAHPRYVTARSHAGSHPYGVERVRADDAPIVIVEGALDTLARRVLDAEAGRTTHVVGLMGLEQRSRIDWRPIVEGRDVHLALDADEAAERVVLPFADELRDAGAKRVQRLTPRGGKDWGEVLCRVRGAA